MSNDQLQLAENDLNAAINKIKGQEIHIEQEPKEDNSVEVEVEEDQEQEQSQQSEQEQGEEKKPHRSEFVETDDPKVLQRINDLYGQVKKSDARNQMYVEHNKKLEERLTEALDKLSELERNTKTAASTMVEKDLKTKMREARDNEDWDTFEELNDQLLDLKMEKRFSSQKENESKQQKQQKEQQLTPEQQQQQQTLLNHAAYIESLAQEKDTTGNPLRPYLYDWHPKNEEAVKLFESIPREFAAAGKQITIDKLMDVMHERLMGKKSNSPQQVLSNDRSGALKGNTVKLTQDELYVAKKMGITPEAYAKQKRLLQR